MSNQNQTDRPNRSGRTGGRAGTRQQINDLIRDRSPIRDESNQDVQINGERAKTVTQILKEQQAKIDGEGRAKNQDMMAKIFGAMEKLEKAYEEQKKANDAQKKANDAQKEINKDQKEINKELREEINDLKKTRNCSKCDQSVEAKKSYCGTCVHKG